MRHRLSSIASVRQGLSRSGRSIGARRGEAQVRLVSGTNIQDGRVEEAGLETISIDLNGQTEKHLLRPYDVLVTGKSTVIKAAYVPPTIGRAVANSTLLVVRPDDADTGLYLWWFLTSRGGRRIVESRLRASATLSSLLPSALADIEVPLPPRSRTRMFAELIQTTERAYQAASDAARIRRNSVRDRLIQDLLTQDTKLKEGAIDAAD